MHTNRMFQVIVATGMSLTSYACGSTVIDAQGSGTTSGGMGASGGMATSGGQGGFPMETATCVSGQCTTTSGGGLGGGGGFGGAGGASTASGVGGFPTEGPATTASSSASSSSSSGCMPDGSTCTANTDCCSTSCFNGLCGFPTEGPCVPMGGACSSSVECCGETCIDGMCGLPPPMDAGAADSGLDGAADAGVGCFPSETAIACPDAGP